MGFKRGASLVEILVVLVVLLIGIFAFVRLFPSGFFILQQSGQTGSATRLAEHELERLKGRRDALPYAIVPIKDQNGFLVIDPDTEPNVADVNRIRRVIGERVSLPLPAPTSVGLGSVYMTLFAPLVEDPSGGTYLQVYSNPMRRLVREYEEFVWLRPFEYAIDYEAGYVAFRPNRYRTVYYKVDFAFYREENGVVKTVQTTQTITVYPADPPYPNWYPLKLGDTDLKDLPGYLGVVPDSDLAARLFERIPDLQPWDRNYPYEYKVLNNALGLLVFNPNAAGYYERFWRGLRPLVANLDYNVRDWQIIRDERIVPDNRRLKLTFREIKKNGELQNDQTPYKGLGIPRDPPNEPDDDKTLITGKEDILLINVEDGGVAKGGFKVDYRAGWIQFEERMEFARVKYDYNTGERRIERYPIDLTQRSLTLRILYKVQDEWAMAVQKAPERFLISPQAPPPTFDSCYIGASNNWGDATKLYFRLSEAGKTIVLREYWYRTNNGSRRGVNGIFKVNDNPALYETANDTVLTWIDLRERHPNAIGWAPEPTGVAVRGVQGVSLKVRMTWQPPGQRLRKIDFDTLLVRED